MKAIGVLAVLAGAVLGCVLVLDRLRRRRDQYNPNNWIHNHAERAWQLKPKG